MRLYTRTRLVLSCIVPGYLVIGFFVSSFLAMWKSEIEVDLQIRAALVADEMALLLTHTRAEDLEAELEERVKSHAWLQQISILDSYGRVIASDGSALGREGILAHDVARRRQILQASEVLFFPETCEFFRPHAIGSQGFIIRVGLNPGNLRRRVWWALRWFLPGWLIAGLMTLLAALYFSRITLERLVSSMANQVNRVADGKSADPLLVNEPAVEPLADGLRRLFRSIEADRSRMGSLERNITQSRDRATHGRQELGRILQEKERALSLFREESRLLWERCGCGILRLGADLHIQAVNSAARHWLSLGPNPDPADLPKGLVCIVECANESPGPAPSHGTFTARHPFFGHERRMDATCIPLGPSEPPDGKPILVFLEEHSPSKTAAAAEPPPLEGFLRLLKGTLISVGQEFHAIEGLRKGPERGLRTRQTICRLARVVRDLETLIGSQRTEELLRGSHSGTCGGNQLTAAVTQAARYLGVTVELEIDDVLAGGRRGLEGWRVSIEPQLLDIVFRESFAVVGDLNSSTSLVFSVTREGEDLVAIVSSQGTGGERGLFAQTLSEYLQKARGVRKSADLILLRIALVQKILEKMGGKIDVSPDREGLLLSVPFSTEGSWVREPAQAQSLARAFLS